MEMHGKYESGNEEEDNDEVHDQILMFFLLKDCSSLKASPPNDGYLASFILPFKPLQDQNRCHYHQCHHRHHLHSHKYQGDINCGASSQAYFILNYFLSNSPFPPRLDGTINVTLHYVTIIIV